jgi:superoxide dismutase, Fe-Mn family
LQGVFNNAAQHFNHSFFWNSLTPGGGGAPDAKLNIAAKIDADFGSYDAFKKEFATKAATQFGSGWAWLVHNHDDGKLQVLAVCV